jgi:UDP:flavonoid glycosyltransferase YjiC (YdhE family)
MSRPLQVVLASVGTRGDVQPMVAVALALAARGHQPLLMAPPDFETWVSSFGLAFRPLGPDMREFIANQPQMLSGNAWRSYRAIRNFYADETPRQAARLIDACRGADALLWAGGVLCAPAVAEHLRLPALGLLYSTSSVPSSCHPPPTSTRHGRPAWVNRLKWTLLGALLADPIGRPLNRQRRALGLPALSLRRQISDGPALALACDPVVLPPDPAWADRIPSIGFIFLDDPTPLDAELEAWLDAGPAPVYIGFGSMSGAGPARVEGLVVEAMRKVGLRALVGTGWGGLSGLALPSGWRRVGDVAHARLFPRMAVVVHHGGAGTTASALRSGVPQVVLPLILDQYHHAHRLHLAGLVPQPVPMERVTAVELAASIIGALSTSAALRQAAAQRLQVSDACGELVRRVEAVAGRSA